MTTVFVPGWYVDPSDSTRVRYWDGSRWTKDTWDLAEAADTVMSGPVPPISLEVEDEDEDDFEWVRPSAGRGRLGFVLVLAGCLVVAAGAIAAWRLWG
jgi:hypothetical protein